MTRGRIITALIFLAITGVGLTALMAAKDATDKPADPPRTIVAGKKLVCLGTVDTEDTSIDVFPDNYPLPSKVVKVLVGVGIGSESASLLELDVGTLQLQVERPTTILVAKTSEKEKAVAMVKAFPSTGRRREGMGVQATRTRGQEAGVG